jgi:hypothetical protein
MHQKWYGGSRQPSDMNARHEGTVPEQDLRD